MDEIDRRLLSALQENCKLAYAELGDRVGLSVSSVSERLKKLQSTGVIRASVALVDPHSVGLDLLAFMQVVTDQPKNETTFVRLAAQMPEVQECHHVTGEFSYLLKIRARNTDHFEALLQDLKSLPGVVRTYTLVVLSSPKETTAVPLQVSRSTAERDE